MYRPFAVVVIIIAALLAALPATAGAKRGACIVGVPGPGCEIWTANVRSVNDGDTIDVDVDGDGTTASRRIRLSGVQAMEQTVYTTRRRAGECHAVEATERLERLIKRGRWKVRLAAEDPLSMSRARFLRTVAVRIRGRWTDVGAVLMREGLALWWAAWSESSPNASYSVLLQRAIAARRGLFNPYACGVGPSPVSPLKLSVNWDADGPDSAEPSGEWVDIRNLDAVNPVPLGGWYLRDAALRRYVFPPHAVIPPGGSITLNVGTAGDDATVFPWGQRVPVFANPTNDEDALGDGAYLFDPLGNVRATMVYPCRWNCTDPLQGAVSIAADPKGRRESTTLTNVSGAPIDLGGYVLKSPPRSYHFRLGSVLPSGGSMHIQIVGDAELSTALDRRWGLASPILRDAGDVVKLLTYTDIPIACVAWGDRSC